MKSEPICFYEREYYVFSSFSSFRLWWKGVLWPALEYAYHAEKFEDQAIKDLIMNAHSAHDAFKIGQLFKEKRRADWDQEKVAIMKNLIRAKVAQHEYVRKKLKDSGDRELIEDSWRDDFWGWGPNKDGKNQLGKLWMEVRDEFNTGFMTFIFLYKGNENLRIWLGDHSIAGITLKLTDVAADITEGHPDINRIVVLAEHVEGDSYKVWAVSHDKRPLLPGTEVSALSNNCLNELWKWQWSKTPFPLPAGNTLFAPIVQDCRGWQYEFIPKL